MRSTCEDFFIRGAAAYMGEPLCAISDRRSRQIYHAHPSSRSKGVADGRCHFCE